MENILGRQLWSIYEDLKRQKKIGFLTDDEFQKYFLGFISYKYLSEKLETYVKNELKDVNLNFEDAYYFKEYKKSLREKSIEDIGYFLSPNLLYKNIVSSKNYGLRQSLHGMSLTRRIASIQGLGSLPTVFPRMVSFRLFPRDVRTGRLPSV